MGVLAHHVGEEALAPLLLLLGGGGGVSLLVAFGRSRLSALTRRAANRPSPEPTEADRP